MIATRVAVLFLWGCAAAPLRVVAAGDLALGPRARASQLADLSAILDGDVRFANLESPLTAGGGETGLDEAGRPTGAPVRLNAPPFRAAELEGRLDLVSLANNHALDQGEAGRDETARRLAAHRVVAAWPGHDGEIVRSGRRVAVVARHYLPDADLSASSAEILAAVAHARRRGIVLVSLHWGHTGSLLPTAAQQTLAARLVDAGATAVLGHGPHTPQGIERRGRGIIAYSLGNLAFDCRCTDETDAYVLAFDVAPDGAAVNVSVLPLVAGLAGAAPRVAHDPGLVDLLETLSRDLGSVPLRVGDRLKIE